MSGFGEHAGYIIGAYGLAALIVFGVVAWVLVDGRAQRRRLKELEARGIRRRSAARRGETP
ncbi:heme exporter protein D [Kaistia soli DSM 19436]|uniref:Heme exporter protein D n=1 Tax=Kaistia soli DSM 19436 TaxID=1122133 RepID=A0A1M5CTA1_9HYPH|nr:heme exporter protein CcmD [Kaistia soli]SHF57890.1 heme exporter protein D [Kaistia soli DSM 19436]